MMTSFAKTPHQLPFRGLKVVELASVLAGPAVGMFFAELGAQVLKVENLASGGDVTRTWHTASEASDNNTPSYFCAVNWGKQSIDADLKTQSGLATVTNLIKDADVVLVNFKSGDARRFGLDYESCAALNTKLIYASLTGYGEQDARPGLDMLIQATSGFLSMNGTEAGELCKLPVALIDLLAAHQLKEGILMALLARQHTGRGQKVEVNLFQSAVASLANQAANYLNTGKTPKPLGTQHPNIAPYGTIVRTRDGVTLILAPGSDKQFFAFCATFAAPLVEDARFSTNSMRVKNREALNTELNRAAQTIDAHTLLTFSKQHGLLVDRIFSIKEVFDSEPLAQKMVLRNHSGKKAAVRSVAFTLSDLQTIRDDLSEPQ